MLSLDKKKRISADSNMKYRTSVHCDLTTLFDAYTTWKVQIFVLLIIPLLLVLGHDSTIFAIIFWYLFSPIQFWLETFYRVSDRQRAIYCKKKYFIHGKNNWIPWVLVSSIGKVDDSWIRDLGFNLHLDQKLIGILVRW